MELEIQKDNSSNEEDTNELKREEDIKGKKNKKGYKKKKKTKMQIECISPLPFIIILLLIAVFFIFIFFQFAIEGKINNINKTINQRMHRKVEYTPEKEKIYIDNKLKNYSEVKTNETEHDVRIPIIEDVKNIDEHPLGFTVDSASNEIMGENMTNKKINIAFQ